MLMMLPFEAPTIFESIHKSYFRMPRVVKDQRSRFESDDLFRQLSHESAVKYIGFKDRPLEERQMKFIANCQEGHTEISVVQSGSQFTLMFNPTINPAYNHEGCDFDKEPGKVHIKAGFILNGVCVLWHGWIDLQRLEGFGCVEFDEYRAYLEDAMAKQSNEKQKSHMNPTGLGLAGQPAPAPSLAATSVAGLIAPPLHTAPLSHYAAVPPPPPPPMPPVSLADPAVQHYGNATLAAAAAAAAFHQAALAIGGAGGPPQQQPPPSSQQPPTSQQPSGLAQAQQQAPPPPPPQAPSLPLGLAGLAPGSPHSSSIFNSISGGGGGGQHRRQATKRAPEELTQTEEVDVVSDIDVHELDIPPRRKFKSDQLKSAASSIQNHNHHNHHHNHHHHHQAASVWTKQTQESSLRSERSR